MHVRTMQTAQILHHAHEWSAQLRRQQRRQSSAAAAAGAPALLVAGDLNADASDAVIRLLTTGAVAADDPDWLHGALHWAPSLELSTAARHAAREAAAALEACADVQGAGGRASTEAADVERAWAQHLRRAEAADATQRSAQVATLEGTRRIACELHLLRKAIQLPGSPRSRVQKRFRADGHAGADDATELVRLAAAIVRDAAAGRTLLDSEALAAAEVARQLRMPLGLRARGAASAAAHATSWFTAAHTRLDELTRRLLAAKGALRARVASEAGAAEAAGHASAAAELWASQAAGLHLSQPTPLTSAYGPDPPPTHAVPRYANTLDWICVDTARLEIVGVAPLPPVEELMRDVAMPSAEWPSDHVSLCVDLAWRNE